MHMISKQHGNSDIKKSGPIDGTLAPGESGIRNIAIRQNCIISSELFANTREIVIQHGDMAYRLRLTAQDKLILTK